MAEDKMMEQEVVQARLENIRLATNIQKKEQLVRQKVNRVILDELVVRQLAK